MAILATRRRWLVTRRCAASTSPCSRQRLASMYSSSGSSSGNFRISWRYRVRLPSGVGTLGSDVAIAVGLHGVGLPSSPLGQTAAGQGILCRVRFLGYYTRVTWGALVNFKVP